MSELRKDPLTGDWAIVAENRVDRPIEFHQQFERNGQYTCPFCKGNELETPPAVAEYRAVGAADDDPSAWAVRVVPNKFPALKDSQGDQQECRQHKPEGDRLLFSLPAVGVNEIIIESSRHLISFSELNDTELRLTMQAFQDAIRRCRDDQRTESVALFKNCRFEAGASIEHTHSQVISLPIVTSQVARQMQNCRDYHAEHKRLLQQAEIEQELNNETRIVHHDGDLVAWCPFASRTPFQTRISFIGKLPKFDELPEAASFRVADLLRRTIRSLEQALSFPAYNVIIQTTPLRIADVDYFHWYLELFPRTTRAAGLELGTSCWINPVSPEQAAQRLRESL